MELTLAILAVVAGATLQRTTGLGFTLVSGPFLVLVLAPYEGVVLANILSLATCLIVLSTTYRHVDLRRAGLLSAGVVAAIPFGAWVARTLSAPLLLLLVGGVSVVAAGAVLANRHIAALRRPSGPVLAGLASGFGNVTAGIGGPPLAILGASTGWGRPSFVPTVQLVGILTNVLSLAAKRDADLPAPLILSCLGGVVLGTLLGRLLDPRISATTARALVLGLAVAGGLASMVKGTLALL